MKFLIVDDISELREILKMDIEANYDVEIIEAVDGQEAIDFLNTKGPFDLVICDYSMPKRSGADVYLELRKLNKTTPFILVSSQIEKFSDFLKHDNLIAALSKPYSEVEFTKNIEGMLAKKTITRQKAGYLPIAIEILEKIEYSGVSLFIQLNQDQYVKVLKEDAFFNKDESERFKKKKLTYLYVELIDMKILISNYRKNVFAKFDWENIDINQALDGLQDDWGLVLDCSKNFGWSESIKTMAKENIARTLLLIKKNPDLKATFERLKLSKNVNQVSPHCYVLVLLVTTILKELDWFSPGTLQKITFAAMLHDMGLTDDAFAVKLQRISEVGFRFNTGSVSDLIIQNHPIKAAEFVSFWTSCPSDVDKLILQHHERFDGQGFPNKLNFLTLFPLAGIMIIAEDIVYQTSLNNELDPVEYLKTHESYYSRGEFKKIYSSILNTMREIRK